MKISHIKLLKNGSYELQIEDNKYRVCSDTLLKYQIFKPCDISEKELKNLLNDNEIYLMMNKMIKYINAHLRTEKQINSKLITLHVGKENRSIIINNLKEKGYLSNKSYISAFINDSINLTLNGPRKIYNTLLNEGFKDSDILDYLNAIDENIYYEKVDKIINKRLKSNHNLSNNKLIQKIKLDLINLGYDEKYYIDKLSSIKIDDLSQMKKDYLKYLKKYQNKYTDDKLDMFIKQKLYSLGYDLNNYEEVKKED